MPRHLISLLSALVLLAVPAFTAAQDRTDDEHMLDLPIYVILCDKDPGKGWDVSGGRGNQPPDILERNNCEPVDDVDITVSIREIGFYDHCTTNDKGRCTVPAPTSPDRDVAVAIHDATLDREVYAVTPVKKTVHYTEFTGVGFVLLHDTASYPDNDRRTLAVRATTDGNPAGALMQMSESEVPAGDAAWLATNDDGWVSWTIPTTEGQVDVIVDGDVVPDDYACATHAADRVDVESIKGRDDNFLRVTIPKGDSDIRCDVALPPD